MTEIQTRRFEREWRKVESLYNRVASTDAYSGSEESGKFLALADLSVFEAKFLVEGVEKISHLTDVTAEDLATIGMLDIKSPLIHL